MKPKKLWVLKEFCCLFVDFGMAGSAIKVTILIWLSWWGDFLIPFESNVDVAENLLFPVGTTSANVEVSMARLHEGKDLEYG